MPNVADQPRAAHASEIALYPYRVGCIRLLYACADIKQSLDPRQFATRLPIGFRRRLCGEPVVGDLSRSLESVHTKRQQLERLWLSDSPRLHNASTTEIHVLCSLSLLLKPRTVNPLPKRIVLRRYDSKSVEDCNALLVQVVA